MQVARGKPEDESSLLAQIRALPEKRLTHIEVFGKRYFVKMPEAGLSLRWRLQKGAPEQAFRREIKLLQEFARRGAAVAHIVAQDDRRVALADHGMPLQHLVYRKEADALLMRKLGAALADLHRLGLAHGRPSLRDVCWDGATMTFLDLEAGARLHARPQDQARDLYLMLHSIFTADGASSPLAEPALEAYLLQGDPKVCTATQQLARRLWVLDLLSRPVVWVHKLRGKTRSEFAAIRAARRLILAE